ncbi:MAG TPA: hypothetical protein VMA75_03330 [Candidatus Paceibacterota bacterium]|nr:hypothetical protein [Candidatus Paceibacterota bacterium]
MAQDDEDIEAKDDSLESDIDAEDIEKNTDDSPTDDNGDAQE